MRLLLDSHMAFWLALKRESLKPSELAILADPANELFVSAVSIWELRIKWEKRFVSGARKGEASPADVLNSLRLMGVELVDLDGDLAVAVLAEPISHGDPFDELLLATAQERGLKLLTRDGKMTGHCLAMTAG
jgi:PIN domain nuclease of toxin-antitoxin system